MQDGHELWARLRHHIGSLNLFRHSLVASFTYTEGVRDFAQHAGNGAYWLLDILATEPAIRKQVFDDGFASVKLTVHPTGRATLTVDDGNDRIVWSRGIDTTDCPPAPTGSDVGGAWLFFIEPNQLGDGRVVMTMMLPQER